MKMSDKNNLGEIVLNVSRSILEKKSFTEAARAIFTYCRKLTGAKSGYIALLTEDGKDNEMLFLESGGLPCRVDPDLPMPLRGLRVAAYKLGKAVFENDFMSSKWAAYVPEGHVELQNVMFAPLNVGPKIVGVIGLANKPGGFSDKDVEIADAFGELAALALQNSRLIERINDISESLFIPQK